MEILYFSSSIILINSNYKLCMYIHFIKKNLQFWKNIFEFSTIVSNKKENFFASTKIFPPNSKIWKLSVSHHATQTITPETTLSTSEYTWKKMITNRKVKRKRTYSRFLSLRKENPFPRENNSILAKLLYAKYIFQLSSTNGVFDLDTRRW